MITPYKVSALADSSRSAILMEEDSGRILYSKNINEQKLIASITKIMTAVIAIESNQLDDTVKVNESILKSYGSNIYIQVGEEITLRDLVYGLMLQSGNDAALAISDYLLGSEEKFVIKMNEKARELGMSNTIFKNSNGLDENGGNLSTAYDMAMLTRYADHLSEYKKVVGTKKYVAKSSYKTYVWANKNKLLSIYKYTTGGKTGFTEKAGRTLVSSATKNNLDLIVVTLQDPNDWTTHQDLYEYGFNNFTNYRILNKSNFEVKSNYYKDKKLYIMNDYYYPLQEGEKNSISIKVKLEKLDYYHNKDRVGVASVYLNDIDIHDEDVYVMISKSTSKGFFSKLWKWLKR
jgi:D-alanyl-D-alanine carboxypeptidase